MEEMLSALPALLEEFDDNETVREAVVFAVWRRIAGENLRGNAVPFRLFQKQLIVAVGSDTWKKNLEDLSGQMIFKLNSMLKQAVVTFIEFRVDEEFVLKERAKNQKTALSATDMEEAAMKEITGKLKNSAKAIRDASLRKQFLLAAGNCLLRKKRFE
jgi:hypothetical protein